MSKLVTISLKLPRNIEVTPEAAKTFLSTLTSINNISSFQKLFGAKTDALSLEIVTINQQIQFLVTADHDLIQFIQTQLQSNYPLVIMQKINDPLEMDGVSNQFHCKSLKLKNGSYYPIATYDKFTDIDPMASILSVLSKSESNEVSMVQLALEATGSNWQSKGASYADFGTKNEDGTYSPRSDKNIIVEKISYPGFKASIRVASTSNKTLNELYSSFNVYARSDGNSLVLKKTGVFGKSKIVTNLIERKVVGNDILNIMELATIWHLPSDKIKTATIAWGTSVLSEPPENLPNAITATDEDKQHINFFAKTVFKNRDTIFGIKDVDRRRHIWCIGKTGTGKSTCLENMAIDDMKKDRGICYIDPHGDACEILLDYVPKKRINDVIYFNPADSQYPITINPLEVRNKEEAELVVSGLMAIFTKVWANVWSARMEYILRNAFLTLAEVPGSTLADVLSLISNQGYRAKVVEKLADKALVNFWRDEFDKMPPNLQKEAIAPIQNKVGQFVTSPMIRRVIGNAKSTIALDDVMNDGKIILANLSQGKLGEDNSALLGAMLITKLQLVAMRRVNIDEEKRRDF
ncbi:MAG: DUF87 domain-containing protein, partial [Candidatus Woesebacteria bacterium]|nr:DUF87 domain-containing protein [Candidatus Woesebacteria bacterium]